MIIPGCPPVTPCCYLHFIDEKTETLKVGKGQGLDSNAVSLTPIIRSDFSTPNLVGVLYLAHASRRVPALRPPVSAPPAPATPQPRNKEVPPIKGGAAGAEAGAGGGETGGLSHRGRPLWIPHGSLPPLGQTPGPGVVL